MSHLALIAGAYLLGSVSFGYLVVWLLRGVDVRSLGSGNPGATNVLRIAGPVPALAVLLLDLGKGGAMILVGRWLGAPDTVLGLAAVAAVVGHVLPLYFGFRGGKGVATTFGAAACLSPGGAVLAALVFILVVGWKRYVSLGSIAAAGSFPMLVYLGGRAGWFEAPGTALLLSAAALGALVVLRHRDNIERLLAGVERKLGERVRG